MLKTSILNSKNAALNSLIFLWIIIGSWTRCDEIFVVGPQWAPGIFYRVGVFFLCIEFNKFCRCLELVNLGFSFQKLKFSNRVMYGVWPITLWGVTYVIIQPWISIAMVTYSHLYSGHWIEKFKGFLLMHGICCRDSELKVVNWSFCW